MSVSSVGTVNEVNQSRGSLRAWMVVFSASLYFFFQFIQLNMLNSLGASAFQYFHVTSAQFANFTANYFLGDVLFLFPAGIIIDRCSTRKVLIVAMFASILSTFGIAMSTHIIQADICRFITGASAAFCVLSIVKLASRWFPPKRLAFVIGLAITFAMLGGYVAQTPLAQLSHYYGFKNAMLVNMSVGVLFFIFLIVTVKDCPSSASADTTKAQAPANSAHGFISSIMLVLKNPQNWLAGIFASLINLPVFLLGASAADMYLEQVGGFSFMQASSIAGMLFIGMIIGCPLFGWWSDTIEKRRFPMIVGVVASLAIILAIMYLSHHSFDLQLLLFFMLGVSISAQTLAYPLVAESNPDSIIGTANGLASVFIMSGGFLIPLFTWLLTYHSSGVLVDGVPQYSLLNFQHAFFMMPVAFLLALIAALLIKETGCRNISQS